MMQMKKSQRWTGKDALKDAMFGSKKNHKVTHMNDP